MILEDLAAIDIERPGEGCLAQTGHEPFCAIFAEKSNEAVASFVRARSKVFMTMSEAEHLHFDPEIDSLTDIAFLRRSPTPQPEKGERSPSPLAANLSRYLFSAGAVNNIPIRIRGPRFETSVTSTRSGLIMVADDYRGGLIWMAGAHNLSPAERSVRQRVEQIHRQSLLVHEARHSDCPGGFDAATIRQAKRAVDHEHFLALTNNTCGNPHDRCQMGVYRGYDACERSAWGSYAVQLVFLMEAREKEALGSVAANVLDGLIVDLRSRFESHALDVDAMLAGKLGGPGALHDDSANLVDDGRSTFRR